MRDAVMQRLADHPGVVLRHLDGKQRAIRQLAHGEIADTCQHLIHIEQEGWAEVRVILLLVAVVLEDPAHPRHRRSQQRAGFLAPQQQQGGICQSAPARQLGFVEKGDGIPAVHLGGLGGKLGLVLGARLGDGVRVEIVQGRPLAHLRAPVDPAVPDLSRLLRVFAQFGLAGTIADIGRAVEFHGPVIGRMDLEQHHPLALILEGMDLVAGVGM